MANSKPVLGEIRKAQEVGRKGRFKYIWHKCTNCGLERWVLLKQGKPQSDRCHLCGVRAGSLKRVITRVTITCETCGELFQAEFRRKDIAKYCSRECRKLGRYTPCDNCGKRIYLPRYRERLYTNHFCSIQCQDNFKSKMFSQNHPRLISLDNIEDFTPEQKELIIGSILGDASLLKNSNGNAHFSVAHSAKQLDYLIHKQELLQPLSRPINYYDRFDKRHGKTYRTYRFFTRCHPYLTELHRLFYGPNGKEIPESIIDNLTPRSLAYWFFDDGSAGTGNSLKIATPAFPRFQVEQTCRILEHKFGIECHIIKRGDIYISGRSINRVRELIKPFIIPSMEYKLWRNK